MEGSNEYIYFYGVQFLDVSDININLEEGFLNPVNDHNDESYTHEAFIIVPPSASGNVITMFNVEKFMNDGVYVSSDEIKKVVFNISIHR